MSDSSHDARVIRAVVERLNTRRRRNAAARKARPYHPSLPRTA